jgi:hypothetical protein
MTLHCKHLHATCSVPHFAQGRTESLNCSRVKSGSWMLGRDGVKGPRRGVAEPVDLTSKYRRRRRHHCSARRSGERSAAAAAAAAAASSSPSHDALAPGGGDAPVATAALPQAKGFSPGREPGCEEVVNRFAALWMVTCSSCSSGTTAATWSCGMDGLLRCSADAPQPISKMG